MKKPLPPPLTPEQAQHKLKLQDSQTVLETAKENLRVLRETCPHQIVSNFDKYDPSVYCTICGEGFGWYCEKSPDHACHYFSEKGDHDKIKLVDGTLVDNPAATIDPDDVDYENDTDPLLNPYDASYENDDECLFCGAPDERK